MDYTKAAKRGIENAIRGSCLPLFSALELESDAMRVQVTVGVQDPAAVDVEALVAVLPRGRAEVRAVLGGQNVVNDEIGSEMVIATVAVEAFLPRQEGWRLRE